MKNQNKILLKPPQKPIPLLFKCGLVAACILFGLLWLYYFIDQNDLVHQPYFPSTLSLYLHHGIAWFSAVVVFVVFIVIFLSASYEWVLNYYQHKFTQYTLGGFLFISGLFLALFFGSIAKTMAYTALNAMSSQAALYIGAGTSKQATIFITHAINPSYQQKIQVKRGKVMVWIIDPVSYRFNIQLTFDGQLHQLDPYCYSGSPNQPTLHTPQFKINGIESFLGFRCTSGCEFYQYFEIHDQTQLSTSNFSSCRKIYVQQTSLK